MRHSASHVLALLLLPTLAGAASFTRIGSLQQGDNSYGAGVSADGSTVVGYNEQFNTSTNRALRWTSGGGLQGLDFLSTENVYQLQNGATGTSFDGGVTVGWSQGPFGFGPLAVRWTGAGAVQTLGALPGDNYSEANGVSADGNVVVGFSNHYVPSTSLGYEAFRWVNGVGMVGLGSLAPGLNSRATAVSADGEVVVGYGDNAAGDNEAFRWANGAMAGLGYLPGGDTFSRAAAASTDGTAVVGRAADAYSFSQPFLWTAGTGMMDLGRLNGCYSGVANGVSGNGQIVVGTTICGEAFVWTQAGGMRSLLSILVGKGVTGLTGYSLDASGISADGQWIVGTARRGGVRSGFVANIGLVPVPSAVWLFGSAVGFLGVMRRKQSEKRDV